MRAPLFRWALAAVAAGMVGAALGGVGSVQAQPAAHPQSLTSDSDCNACHTTDGWKLGGTGPVAAGFDHNKTGFPLTGEHEHTSCIGCHVPGRPMTRECAGCHADSHEGRMGASCDRCHNSITWNDTKGIEDHRRTRLPLTGMHALIGCTSCHLRNGERVFSEVPADCFSCHESDYRRPTNHPSHVGIPALNQAPFPRDCTGCHTSVGWTPAYLPANLIGSAATAAPSTHEALFPIRSGAHRGAACNTCHEGGTGPVSCEGCHQHSPLRMIQVHRGRAMPPGARACLGCHPGGAAR